MIPGYSYITNLSFSDCLIDINHTLWIGAKLEKVENKMIYKFILDTEFLSSKELSYDDIVLVKNIIDILEKNRRFVLKRLKKYTIEEYEEEQRIKEEQSNMMLESLKNMFINLKNSGGNKDE